MPLPGRLAAKWFGPNEQSTATALGIFGIQLGLSISFVACPIFVRNHESLEEIEKDLTFLAWLVGISTTITLILVTLCKHCNESKNCSISEYCQFWDGHNHSNSFSGWTRATTQQDPCFAEDSRWEKRIRSQSNSSHIVQ